MWRKSWLQGSHSISAKTWGQLGFWAILSFPEHLLIQLSLDEQEQHLHCCFCDCSFPATAPHPLKMYACAKFVSTPSLVSTHLSQKVFKERCFVFSFSDLMLHSWALFLASLTRQWMLPRHSLLCDPWRPIDFSHSVITEEHKWASRLRSGYSYQKHCVLINWSLARNGKHEINCLSQTEYALCTGSCPECQRAIAKSSSGSLNLGGKLKYT